MSEYQGDGELPVEEDIRGFVEEMVERLEWELNVTIAQDDDEMIRIELSGDDRDLMMQNRAEVLDSVQYLTNRIFGRSVPDRRIVIDCDGYRQRKELELREIAARVAERVKRSGQEEELGRMNPYERRVVHLAVAELDGVSSESDGDGVMKRVVIFPS